jgi:hypothetical protein
MSGRQKWHWFAAGVAGLAVAGAVLANGATTPPTLSAHPFPTVEFHAPDNGSVVVATPLMDATTVTSTTPKPVKTSSSTPPPSPPSDQHTETKLTVTFSIPDIPLYFPNCSVAKALGAAPIRKGQPGYRDELDRDHNGVACEY